MEILLCTEDLGDYDAGDIIDIRGDGFNWGKREKDSPCFKIIKMSEIDIRYLDKPIYYCEICNQYIGGEDVESHIDLTHKEIAYDENGLPISNEDIGIYIVKQKRWKIDTNNKILIEKIPQGSSITDRVDLSNLNIG